MTGRRLFPYAEPLLAAALLLAVGAVRPDVGLAAEETDMPVSSLVLQPGLPALATPGVPTLTAQPPDADRLSEPLLSIAPERPFHWVYAPGERISLAVEAALIPDADRAVLTAWDWEMRPVARVSSPLPWRQTVSFGVSGRGTYVLTLDAMLGLECRARLVRSVAVCPDNARRRASWQRSGFWVGQCSFPAWQEARLEGGHTAHPEGLTAAQSRDLDAALVARMGVSVARVNMDVIRRDEAGLDLDFTQADECVQAFTSRGLPILLHLFAAAGHGLGPVLPRYSHTEPGLDRIYPIQEGPYRHFVRESLRRYGRQTAFVQVGNEPSNELQYRGTPEEYAANYRQAADEVHRALPSLPVTNGGYCNTYDAALRIATGIRGLTDFTSYHWHGGLPGLKGFFGQVREMQRRAGAPDGPYANTEMGYAMPTVGGERANAVAEMQKLLWCWAHGHAGVMLYSSRELWWPRQFSYNGISDYGFVDHFFCPRFAYGAAAAFLDHYAGYRFDRVLEETDNLHVYAFRRGSERLVAIFAVAEPVTVTLESDGQGAVLLDSMGNEMPCPDGGRVTVQAGEYPQSVRFRRATHVRLTR